MAPRPSSRAGDPQSPGMATMPLRWLKFAFERNESDFDFFIQHARDSLEHRKRVASVIAIFQTADDRRGRSNKLREAFLGQSGLFAQFINLTSNFVICPLLLKLSDASWLSFLISPLQNLDCI